MCYSWLECLVQAWIPSAAASPKEDFQISQDKTAQARLNHHSQQYCPLIALAKVKSMFLLSTPFRQSLHDVIIKMNSRWKPTKQIHNRAAKLHSNLTACRHVVFLTQHLSFSQLLKQKGGHFASNKAKLGSLWTQTCYQVAVAPAEATTASHVPEPQQENTEEGGSSAAGGGEDGWFFSSGAPLFPSVLINHCCYF